MNNLNFNFELPSQTWRPNKTYDYLGNICSSNCPTLIKGFFWIANQPFWSYQCLCCNAYQFKKGKTTPKWGETHD